MNKTDFCKALSSKTDLSIKDSAIILDATLEILTETLKNKEKISFVGFGSFEAKKVNARTCRNPKTGESMEVPAKTVPSFKAGKSLKEIVNG